MRGRRRYDVHVLVVLRSIDDPLQAKEENTQYVVVDKLLPIMYS